MKKTLILGALISALSYGIYTQALVRQAVCTACNIVSDATYLAGSAVNTAVDVATLGASRRGHVYYAPQAQTYAAQPTYAQDSARQYVNEPNVYAEDDTITYASDDDSEMSQDNALTDVNIDEYDVKAQPTQFSEAEQADFQLDASKTARPTQTTTQTTVETDETDTDITDLK